MDAIDSKALLTCIDGADWNVEIGAISETVAFSHFPHSLLFDSIKGYPKGFRVATNLFVSPSFKRLLSVFLKKPLVLSLLSIGGSALVI